MRLRETLHNCFCFFFSCFFFVFFPLLRCEGEPARLLTSSSSDKPPSQSSEPSFSGSRITAYTNVYSSLTFSILSRMSGDSPGCRPSGRQRRCRARTWSAARTRSLGEWGRQSSHGDQDPTSDSPGGLHGYQCQPCLSEMGKSILDHSWVSGIHFMQAVCLQVKDDCLLRVLKPSS